MMSELELNLTFAEPDVLGAAEAAEGAFAFDGFDAAVDGAAPFFAAALPPALASFLAPLHSAE